MHVKYSAQWPSHIGTLCKLALDIIIHILCILCSCWPRIRCWIKESLSTIYTKSSRVWSCESSYKNIFIMALSPTLCPFLIIVLRLNMFDVILMMKTSIFFYFLSQIYYFRKLIKYGINVGSWFGNCKQRPSLKKILYKTWQKCQLVVFLDQVEFEKQEIYAHQIHTIFVCTCISRQVSRDLWRRKLKITLIPFVYPEIPLTLLCVN